MPKRSRGGPGTSSDRTKWKHLQSDDADSVHNSDTLSVTSTDSLQPRRAKGRSQPDLSSGKATPARRRSVPEPKRKKDHWSVCAKCFMGPQPPARRKGQDDDDDLVGDFSEFLVCSTCTASYHADCVPKSKGRASIDDSTTSSVTTVYGLSAKEKKRLGLFVCPMCSKEPPKCAFCGLDHAQDVVYGQPTAPSEPLPVGGLTSEVVNGEVVPEGNQVHSPATVTTMSEPMEGVESERDPSGPEPPVEEQSSSQVVKEAPEASKPPLLSQTPSLSMTSLQTSGGDTTDPTLPAPMFRCIHCTQTSHIDCLTASFQKEFPDSLANMTKSWECTDCIRWYDPNGQLTILTYTSTPLEYLIKWSNQSYRHLPWVSDAWLRGVASQKVTKFWKKVAADNELAAEEDRDPEWPKPAHDVVDPAWTIPERILDVHYDGKGSSLKHIQKVYVKWTRLPFEACTWESWPSQDDEVAEPWVTAYDAYKTAQSVNTLDIAGKAGKKAVKFEAFESQPECVVNGVLKDYQLDGLK